MPMLPREKLHVRGVTALRDDELIALIFRVGTRGKSVFEESKKFCRKHSFQSLSKASYAELCRDFGLSPSRATAIVALFEIAKRSSQNELIRIQKAKDAIPFFQYLMPKRKEHFATMFLGSRHNVIGLETVFVGTKDSVLIHPREIFEPAFRAQASKIIIAHNHPSGDPSPSRADRDITILLKKASKILEIEILDHIILGKNGSYYSFREVDSGWY